MAKAKQRKKRNKKYTGRDAAQRIPSVQHISVPDRSKPMQWMHENRQRISAYGVIIGVSLILFGLLSLAASWIF